MDSLHAPKLLAAGLIGLSIGLGTTLRPNSDSVSLEYEWIQSDKGSEKVVMRVPLDRKSSITQGTRRLEATPKRLDNGTYSVDLQITTLAKNEAVETVSTEVICASGETNVVYATTRKSGRKVDAKLFFLTVTPIEAK